MSRFFITGGSGFIGTNLVQSLADKGNQVLNFDINPPRNPEHLFLWVNGDVRNLDELNDSVRAFSPDYFVHLAARTDLDGKSLQDYSANTSGVENCISVIGAVKSIRRVIFTSSRLVCRIGYQPQSDTDYCPTTFYGESKVIGEQLVRQKSDLLPPWVILRPTSIWGPWFDTPYKEFFLSVLNSHYLHPMGSKIKKSFGFVGNTVHEIESVIHCEAQFIHSKTLYLADFPPIEVKEWADMIADMSNNRKPLQVPMFVLRIMAALGDIFKLAGWKKPPLTSFRLNNLLTHMVYNTSAIEQLSSPLPYSTQEGIQQTLHWIESQK